MTSLTKGLLGWACIEGSRKNLHVVQIYHMQI